MNSFKPLTIYKGFVVPEEYVSGAMDSFDVVKYLEQIGLNKESQAFLLSTLKAIQIPSGVKVIHKDGTEYTSASKFPVTKLGRNNSPTWNDFVKYAAEPEAPWDIVDDAQQDVDTNIDTVTGTLEQYISKNNFEGAKQHLTEVLQDAENQDGSNSRKLKKLSNLYNIVEALERQQKESETGLNDVSLAEKLDLETLVDGYDEMYVTLTFDGGLVKVKKANKNDYQESIDLGLIGSLLDAAGFNKDEDEETENPIKTAINDLKEKPSKIINFNLDYLFEFLPKEERKKLSKGFVEDLKRNIFHPEFYEKFEDYNLTMLNNSRKKQEIADHNRPIIQFRDPPPKKTKGFEDDESKKTRRAGHLLDALKFYEEFESKQDKGKELSEKFRFNVERLKELYQKIETSSMLNRSLDEHNVIKEKDIDEQIRILSAKFFSNGRLLWETLFKSLGGDTTRFKSAQKEVNDIFRQSFELVDGNNNKQPIYRDGFILEDFDTHTLVVSDVRPTNSESFADNVVNALKKFMQAKLKEQGFDESIGIGKLASERLSLVKAYAYLVHQYNGTKSMADFMERDNMLHTNEFLTLILGNNFNTDFISGILEDPNNPDVYFPLQILMGIRFLPFISGQNKLDFDTETRQRLLRNSGLDALNYGPEIFDDISGNAVPVRRALQPLFNSNFLDSHERHISHLLKRVSRSATNSDGTTILDVDTVNGSTIGTVDVLPSDFDSPENIEQTTKQIFTGNTFNKLTTGTPEERQEAKTTIMDKFKAFLDKVNGEDAERLVNFAEQIIDNAIGEQRKKSSEGKDTTGKIGFFFEDVGLIPVLATYAKQGSMKNVSDSAVPERFSNNSDANNSFYSSPGFSWTMTNADGQEEDYVLGGPKSTGSAGDAFLQKFNFETGKMEGQTVEIKQGKKLGAAGHIGQTTKMVKYAFDSLNSFSKSKSSENPVSFNLRPSLNISIPWGDGAEVSVDRMQNFFNLNNEKSFSVRGVLTALGTLNKRN